MSYFSTKASQYFFCCNENILSVIYLIDSFYIQYINDKHVWLNNCQKLKSETRWTELISLNGSIIGMNCIYFCFQNPQNISSYNELHSIVPRDKLSASRAIMFAMYWLSTRASSNLTFYFIIRCADVFSIVVIWFVGMPISLFFTCFYILFVLDQPKNDEIDTYQGSVWWNWAP